MNDLPILPRLTLERIATDPRDFSNDHDVTSAILHEHWATLSNAYVAHPDIFRQEAAEAWSPRAERLRDKIASLS